MYGFSINFLLSLYMLSFKQIFLSWIQILDTFQILLLVRIFLVCQLLQLFMNKLPPDFGESFIDTKTLVYLVSFLF